MTKSRFTAPFALLTIGGLLLGQFAPPSPQAARRAFASSPAAVSPASSASRTSTDALTDAAAARAASVDLAAFASEPDAAAARLAPGAAPPGLTPSAAFSLTLAVEPQVVAPGDLVTLTVTLSSHGPAPLRPLAITNTLPAGLAYQDGSDPGAAYSPAAHSLSWRLDALAAGRQLSASFRARVSEAAAPGTLVNELQAVVEGLMPANARAAVTVRLPAKDSGRITSAGGVLEAKDGALRVVFPPGVTGVPLEARTSDHRDSFQWGQAALWAGAGLVIGATLGTGAELVAGALGAQAAAGAATATAVASAAAPVANTGIGTLSRAAEFGIRSYNELRGLTSGTGLRVHHLIEARLADALGLKRGAIPSIALTPQEHQVFTNAWRNAAGYINSGKAVNTITATRQDAWQEAQRIYADYPDLLRAVWQCLFGD